MPSSHTTIHVDPRADVATVADKIIRSAAQKIYLAVDNDARIAYHVLNFQLLSREAQSAGKELIIVSSSIRVQALATKARLSVQESGGGMVAGNAEETQQDNSFSAVRLGARRVADIIPRHPQDIVPADTTRIPITEKEDEMQKQTMPSGRQARKRETEYVQATGGEDVQGMKDILRRETRVQDSAWRKFLRVKKKGAAPEENSSLGRGARHRLLRIRLPFGRIGADSFSRRGLTGKRPVRFSFVWGSFVVAIFLIGIFVASTILPTVSIALTPHTQKTALQIPVHVDSTVSQVDVAHHILPGQVIQESVQNSQTFAASTKQNVQTFATGQIRVFNQFSSAPQALVQNTRFVSQDGLLFHTTQSVVIPGAQIQNGQIVASSLVVNVQAAEAGDKYNINPATFSIPGFQGTPKFTAFYGKSESSMKGGFNGTATVVSDSDVAGAKDVLGKLGNNQLQAKLKSHVPAGFVLSDDAIEQEAPAVTLSAQSGDRADNFTGTIQNSVKAVIFRQDDVQAIIDSYLKNEYKGDPSMDALPQADIHYVVVAKDFGKGKFDINLQINQIFATHIDAHTIATMVRGMTEINVRSYLASYPGIDQASVTFWPFWVHSVPDNQERISLKVQYP